VTGALAAAGASAAGSRNSTYSRETGDVQPAATTSAMAGSSTDLALVTAMY
jgi:hypothetical protein